MASRHRLRITEDLYRPLPVKSEAVGSQIAATANPVIDATDSATEPLQSGEAGLDGPELIDESERLLSAADLYEAAYGDTVNPVGATTVRRSTAAPNQTRVPLWGQGTSGVPRKGSRCVRLFHCEPSALIDRVLVNGHGAGPLQLANEVTRTIDGDELHVNGELAGAFALRSETVDVSVRICRFNAIFSIAEVTLQSRRHPRRFFDTAHQAISQLCN